MDCKLWYLTRLLGRPQTQMYPSGRPKSVHGSTKLVNILYSCIYIYASRPHKHFKIDFTPKLSSQQHVEYGSNLMNIFDNFFSIYGGGGGSWGSVC